MSALEKVAATLVGVQESLERAADVCDLAASHADDAHQAATATGSAQAVSDAEDVRSVLATLRQQVGRVVANAAVVAGVVRTVIHGGTDPAEPSADDPAPGGSDEPV